MERLKSRETMSEMRIHLVSPLGCFHQTAKSVSGHAIFGSVHRIEDGGSAAAASLLSQAGEGKALMFVSNDESEISVIENPSSPAPRFIRLKRDSRTPLVTPPVPKILGP